MLKKYYKIMQNENRVNFAKSWKSLGQGISVGQFSSCGQMLGKSQGRIYVKKYEPLVEVAKNKITVFLIHDICQHSGRFNKIVNWMREKNPRMAFIAMDFLGHGLSSGTRGHFDELKLLVNDFHFMINQFEKKNEDDEKWIILGHGVGGLVALDFLSRFEEGSDKKIDGLILSNFILKLSSRLLGLEGSSLLKSLGIKNKLAHVRPYKIFNGKDLLTIPEEALNYEQDPLVVHRPTFSTIKEIQNKIKSIYQYSYFLDKPIMLLNSVDNPVCTNESMNYFSKGIKKILLTEKNYSHMKHDLYNEKDRELVFLDILAWIKLHEI